MNYKYFLLSSALLLACGDNSTNPSENAAGETLSSSSHAKNSSSSLRGTSSEVEQNKSSSSAANLESDSIFVDPRDGQEYPIFTIKSQRWLARNMNYAIDSSWCYNNNEKNCEQLGRAYSWESAKQACPEGWRLPTSKDWLSLIKFSSTEGNIYYGSLYDSKGFHLMKAGHYSEWNDKLKWNSANESAYFWDAEEINDEYAASMTFYSERNYLFLDSANNGYVLSKKSDKLSVRCIHENKGTMKDSRDGQTYKTIRLANQIWMQENLNYVTDSSMEYTGRNAIKNSGRLYNHSAAMNACPPGWRLPSSKEWNTLLSYKDSSEAIIDRLSLRSSNGWIGLTFSYSDDDFDFTAIPAGTCYDYSLIDEGILCSDAGTHTAFWTSSEDPVKEKYECASTDLIGYGCDPEAYISIRCVKE
ncbi:MAG: hypothetical protein IIT53_09745 [Fibrobacter sp.]|nr:hypothetical protein [Fibrobacter sp.]